MSWRAGRPAPVAAVATGEVAGEREVGGGEDEQHGGVPEVGAGGVADENSASAAPPKRCQARGTATSSAIDDRRGVAGDHQRAVPAGRPTVLRVPGRLVDEAIVSADAAG